MLLKIHKEFGKIIYRVVFGKEKKHLNVKFNNWRYKLISKKIKKNPDLEKNINSVPNKYIENHWVKNIMGPEYKKIITKIRTVETLNFLYRDLDVKRGYKIIDAGASDGLFLSFFKGELIGINIEQVCVDKIIENGFNGCLASIYNLPFKNDYFDAVFCFEVIEHLNDPIKAIRELARIANKYLYISIPWIKKTKLFTYYSEKDKSSTNQRVFEFCISDLKNLVTYADLKISDMLVIDLNKILKLTMLERIKLFLLNYRLPKWTLIKLEK